jgi:two-component system chemotaxis response regulator CheB
MAGHDIIVIGASAGGVEVLTQLVRKLPPSLPASLFVVCHFPPGGRSVLPEILSRAGPLLATHAREGEPFYPGHIYVASPDCHLLLDSGQTRLTHDARENHQRPAIDPLFRSAARVYSRRVIGVVLSGGLDDGVAGLLAIRSSGGIAVIQDPADALIGVLPTHATQIVGADYVVPAHELATLLVNLVHQPIVYVGVSSMTDPLERMPERILSDMDSQVRGERRGQLSTFTCPECGGNLWQVNESDLIRFRCHVGHAYYAERLLGEQSDALEAALWTTVRMFREKGVLARQLAMQHRNRENPGTARNFEDQAAVSERYGNLILQYLLGNAASLEEAEREAAG